MFKDDESLDDSDVEKESAKLIKVHDRRQMLQTRTKCYVEKVIPGYSQAEFKSHFRIERSCYELLLKAIIPQLSNLKEDGRPTINPEKQLLAVIWLLATPDSYRSVADRFDMAKSSLSHAFFE